MTFNILECIRKLLEIERQKCRYDSFVLLNGKKYSVGKMSYDEYFIEPYRKGKTERDNFSPGTLWTHHDGLEILQLLIDDGKFPFVRKDV